MDAMHRQKCRELVPRTFFPVRADARLWNEASALTGVAVSLPWDRHKMQELITAFPRHPAPWRPAALTPPRLKLSAQKRVARSASPCQRLSLVLWEKVQCRECRDGWCEERLPDSRLTFCITTLMSLPITGTDHTTQSRLRSLFQLNYNWIRTCLTS